MEIPCGEVQEIPNGDRVWRRFVDSKNHLAWDYDNNRYVPNPVALAFDPEMSTHWREHLEMHGLGPDSILDEDGKYTLVGEWAVRSVRDMDFPTTHTPDGSEPIACAHTSVYWPPESIKAGSKRPDAPTRTSLRNMLVMKMTLVCGDVTTPPPEDMKS